MSVRQQRSSQPAVGGQLKDGGIKKIAIGFDEQTFDRIAGLAFVNNISFGAQVRQLCQNSFSQLEAPHISSAKSEATQ
jgi:hypothetical protein